jgi:hypothetical protein
MADAQISPPVIAIPHNWEELEQAFASIQRWTNDLTTELNALRSEPTRKGTATTNTMTVGQIGFSQSLFFGEGAAVWTVEEADVERFNYVRIGQLVFIDFSLFTTALATDTSDSLFIRLYDFDVLPGRQQTAANTAAPSIITGTLNWNDVSASQNGTGLVSAVGQNYDTATRSMILQLDRLPGDTTSDSAFEAWPISANFNITGSCWFLTSASNVPVL